MFIERQLKTVIEAGSNFFTAILLTGPRQVGKTTFLRRMAEPERRYVTLDDVSIRTLAKEDPKGFIEKFAPPVLIDEIQYVPELLNYIKMVIDEQRFKDPAKAKGMYWLTGSQRFPLMKGVSESLAGRIGIFEMAGLSQSELSNRTNVPFTPETLEAGAVSGEFFETWCISEILKSYWNAGINEPPLYFYRDRDKKENDLLIESADGFYPIEFKKSSTPGGEDAKHFSVLDKLKIKVKKGAVVCCCPEIMPLPNKDVLCIPASLI